MYVAYVLSGCFKSIFIAYVAMAIHIFFWQYAERVTSPTVSKISLSLGKLMSFSSD